MLVLQAAHNLNNTVRFLPKLFSRNLESTASNSSWVSYRQDHQPFNWTGTSVLSGSGHQRAENYLKNKQRPVVQLSLCNWTISMLFQSPFPIVPMPWTTLLLYSLPHKCWKSLASREAKLRFVLLSPHLAALWINPFYLCCKP